MNTANMWSVLDFGHVNEPPESHECIKWRTVILFLKMLAILGKHMLLVDILGGGYIYILDIKSSKGLRLSVVQLTLGSNILAILCLVIKCKQTTMIENIHIMISKYILQR